jgi:hypothetical protein
MHPPTTQPCVGEPLGAGPCRHEHSKPRQPSQAKPSTARATHVTKQLWGRHNTCTERTACQRLTASAHTRGRHARPCHSRAQCTRTRTRARALPTPLREPHTPAAFGRCLAKLFPAHVSTAHTHTGRHTQQTWRQQSHSAHARTHTNATLATKHTHAHTCCLSTRNAPVRAETKHGSQRAHSARMPVRNTCRAGALPRLSC